MRHDRIPCAATGTLSVSWMRPFGGNWPLLRFRGPSESNVARHRLVDDLLRQAIAACPERRVFVGSRVRHGRFVCPGALVEFDDPALFALKEAQLPAATAPTR